MTDGTPMCICPCNITSTRSQSTSMLDHSTSGANSPSVTSEQRSSFLVYKFTTTATSTTSASSSLSSSVCYCPCGTTSLTSYMLSKYAYGKWLADYQNMLPKWNVSWQPIANVNEAAQNPASNSLNYQLSFCSHCLRHQRMSATLQHQYFTYRVTVRFEKNSSWTKCLGVWKIFTSRFPFYTCNISSKRGTLSLSFKNLLQIFVSNYCSTSLYHVNSYPNYLAIVNRVLIIRTQWV